MSLVRIERTGSRADVVLDRVDRRNALNADLIDDLYQAALEVEHDAGVHCVVVRGAGAGFSSGIDAGALIDLATPEGLRRIQSAFVTAFDRFARMAKPTIAQVHGWAIGAGFELALACDFRVIATDATMGLPETRMGVVPDVGGCSRLTALVGVGRAKELIMTSAMIDGARAGEWGIANRVASAAELGPVTSGLVDELLTCSPHANGLAKALIEQAAMPAHHVIADGELTAQLSCITTEEFRRAAQTFKSAPSDNGRPARRS
jgi:enoyl-CoA hydratase/carnithine racemase